VTAETAKFSATGYDLDPTLLADVATCVEGAVAY